MLDSCPVSEAILRSTVNSNVVLRITHASSCPTQEEQRVRAETLVRAAAVFGDDEIASAAVAGLAMAHKMRTSAEIEAFLRAMDVPIWLIASRDDPNFTRVRCCGAPAALMQIKDAWGSAAENTRQLQRRRCPRLDQYLLDGDRLNDICELPSDQDIGWVMMVYGIARCEVTVEVRNVIEETNEFMRELEASHAEMQRVSANKEYGVDIIGMCVNGKIRGPKLMCYQDGKGILIGA